MRSRGFLFKVKAPKLAGFGGVEDLGEEVD